jgi:hypothetical protein
MTQDQQHLIAFDVIRLALIAGCARIVFLNSVEVIVAEDSSLIYDELRLPFCLAYS